MPLTCAQVPTASGVAEGVGIGSIGRGHERASQFEVGAVHPAALASGEDVVPLVAVVALLRSGDDLDERAFRQHRQHLRLRGSVLAQAQPGRARSVDDLGPGTRPERGGIFGEVLLAAQQAEQHVVGSGILGMRLEARPLEVLDLVALAVGRVDLPEGVGERQPLLRQPAVLVPVIQEATTGLLAGLGEGAALAGPGRRRFDWRIGGGILHFVLLHAKQAEEHNVLALVLRVVLETRSLEVLHLVGLAVGGTDLVELVGEREALLRQAAIRLPVLEEGAADTLAGLGETAAIGGSCAARRE
ncbi:MAG: hypothetical protein U0232_02850 [Thermomicrobiales bacterium]